MKRIILSILISGAFLTGKSQNAVLIDNSSRSTAMGSTGVSAPASAMSVYENTASIAVDDSNKWAVSYGYSPYMRNNLSGNHLHTVAGFYKINDQHGITSGIRYFNKPNTTMIGAETGVIKPYELSVEFGYAYRINQTMGVSLNARYMLVDHDSYGMTAGNAFGFDVGYYFNKDRWSAGAVLSNIGTKINYGGDSYNTPGWVKAGVSYELPIADKHALTGSSQFDYIFQPSINEGFMVGLGLEYTYLNQFSLRGGYRIANDVMGYNYGSIGVGINLCHIDIGVTYLMSNTNNPLNNTLQASIGVKF